MLTVGLGLQNRQVRCSKCGALGHDMMECEALPDGSNHADLAAAAATATAVARPAARVLVRAARVRETFAISLVKIEQIGVTEPFRIAEEAQAEEGKRSGWGVRSACGDLGGCRRPRRGCSGDERRGDAHGGDRPPIKNRMPESRREVRAAWSVRQ